ncbi:SSI family serine proteinase inhibitor [Sphaerisporangium aureirubrum]|uniref:SSI family serine proteinase inhibitor n=1 Tax=Sphaerisporangium aureirubrum TaxID=1544736 RepID=A0ABW1NEQ9_9ACTN
MRPHRLLLTTCALTLAATHPATAHTPRATTSQPSGSTAAHSSGATAGHAAAAGVRGGVTGARPSTPGARLTVPDLTRLTKRRSVLTAALAARKDIRRALLLSVAKGESPTPADHAVLLQCAPASGTHPKAADACRLLEPVSADLNELNAKPDQKCTTEYDPVTVYASGLWDTQRLSYEHTFVNPCELRATTGAVFDLGTR